LFWALARHDDRGCVIGMLDDRPSRTVTKPLPTGQGPACVAALLVGILALLLVVPAAALASPLTQKRARAKEIQRQVMRLNDRTEIIVERYNAANDRLTELNVKIGQNARLLAIARFELATARQRLALHVVAIYKQPEATTLDMLVSSASYTDLVAGLALLKRISDQDATLVTSIGAYEKDFNARRASLKTQRAAAEKLLVVRVQEKTKILAALEQRQRMLAGVKGEIQRLEKQAAAHARARAPPAGQPPVVTGTPGSGTAAAVEIARRYLGVPYVWGGASPSGFDCSGLVMYVFAQLGISLPHNAAAQYGYGTHISRSELQPGDLVFFGLSAAGIHHVGIYAGNGMMIDAPYTGAVVRYGSIDYHYFGATRL
jgi:cell wall-associated NlpC family hydrolase